MAINSHPSRSPGSRRGVWVLSFFLLVLQPAFATAGAEPRLGAAVQAAAVSAPLLAEGWSWRTLFSPVESALSNRRRMIQLATIGMCIGLYILMRR